MKEFELFKPWPGNPDYWVSTLGNVMGPRGKVLRPGLVGRKSDGQ